MKNALTTLIFAGLARLGTDGHAVWVADPPIVALYTHRRWTQSVVVG